MPITQLASKFWKAQLAWKEPSITAGPETFFVKLKRAVPKGRNSEPTKAA